MCKISIEKLQRDDLKNYISVMRSAFGTVAKDFGLSKENCPTNPAFIELKHLYEYYDNGNLMYGVVCKDEIVGFMQLEQGREGKYKLKNVAVATKYRHKGYGKQMLKFAKDKVLELGGTTIEIGIIEENEVLKEWYMANGFVHLETKKFEHLPFTVGFMEMAVD